MKKNKLYIIIAILTTIFLFTISAICNQCAAPTEEEKIGVEEEEAAPEEATAEEVTEEEAAEAEEEEVEEAAEEEAGEEEVAEEEKEAPTISLSIYEGPTYSSADNVCYYRIKATVTGSPTPTVEFSKDDSHGAWGSKKAQVNLNDPIGTYTLTATATNSEGSDTDSIELSWGCNQPPEIAGITIMGTKYINRTYGVGVSASDPDGDSLTYNWSVTGGTIDNIHAQNINWATPSIYGNYTISVTVSDGKGGEDSESVDVYVHFLYDLLERAQSASWHNSSADYHLWNVGLGDSRGFACYRTNITLEDNNIYPKVLETHPEWKTYGYIAGDYPDIIEIPEGARFTARVGFIKDATGTDGADFNVDFIDTSHIDYPITGSGGYHAVYDGALNSLNFDLSSLAGKSGHILLWVHAHNTSNKDWAVWVDPLITN